MKFYNVLSWLVRGCFRRWKKLSPSRVKWATLKLIFGTCLLIGFVFCVKLNVESHHRHELDSAQTPVFPCKRTAKDARELLDLCHDVHEILNELNIRHFLMYGSIWGAYRTKGPLPWDYDIDLGIIGHEAYSQIPTVEFLSSFRRRGITIVDWSKFSGAISFKRGHFAQVDIDIFYNYNGWMQRSGYLTWVLFYNYRKYHRFPAWMVEGLLPKMQFADLLMAVPKGGKTILKYLYPNDWKKPFIPAACLNKEKNSTETIHRI